MWCISDWLIHFPDSQYEEADYAALEKFETSLLDTCELFDTEDLEEPSNKHILSESSILVPIPSQHEPRISKAWLMAEINEYNDRLDAEEEEPAMAYGKSDHFDLDIFHIHRKRIWHSKNGSSTFS